MTNEMLADHIEKFIHLEARQSIGAFCARNAELIVAALRAQSDVRAPAPQGEPVAWRWRWKDVAGNNPWRVIDVPWGGSLITAEVEPLYAAPTPPIDLAEDCAKIAEGHVGAGGYPGDEIEDRCRRIGYDDACRDIAKAIRDTYRCGNE